MADAWIAGQLPEPEISIQNRISSVHLLSTTLARASQVEVVWLWFLGDSTYTARQSGPALL